MGLDITIKSFDKLDKIKNNICKMKYKEWSKNGTYIDYYRKFYEFRDWVITKINKQNKKYDYFNDKYIVLNIDTIYQLEYDIHVKNIFQDYEVTYMDKFIDNCISEISKGNMIVIYMNW